MSREGAITEYVEATRALQSIRGQEAIAADLPGYDAALRAAKARLKAAALPLNGSDLGEARRRLML